MWIPELVKYLSARLDFSTSKFYFILLCATNCWFLNIIQVAKMLISWHILFSTAICASPPHLQAL
jgi:hypothetical protein